MPTQPRWQTPPLALRSASWLISLFPAVSVGFVAVRQSSPDLFAVTVGLFTASILLVGRTLAWKPEVAPRTLIIYLTAWTILLVRVPTEAEPLAHLFRGALPCFAAVMIFFWSLEASGLAATKRARSICQNLLNRKYWPDHFEHYLDIPDVRKLYMSVRYDPVPALELLKSPNEQVRKAGLAALLNRDEWRPAEAAIVAEAGRQSPDPQVRAAALTTISSSRDSSTLTELGLALRDSDPTIRAVAADALLRTTPTESWVIVRDYFHDAMADPALQKDGPLAIAHRLPPIAICDLLNWSMESEPLSSRAIVTLSSYYRHRLSTRPDPLIVNELARIAIDTNLPSGLRIELVTVMRDFWAIPPEILDRMSDPDQPSLVRLLAAEAMLAVNPDHPDAIDVLRGLGRHSNRETGLGVARLLQTYLRIDMGLPEDGTDVSTTSRVAAEATRRAMEWAKTIRTDGRIDPHLRLTHPISNYEPGLGQNSAGPISRPNR